MRSSPVSPVDPPLPWHPAADAEIPATGVPWHFDGAQVAAFDALLHELHPDASRVSPEQLSQLAAWLLSLPESAARELLEQRLRRVDEMRAMLADRDWDCARSDRARVRKLLDYIDRDEDLIPDQTPLLGLLDDILLLELAWPAVVGEAEEYRDFCAYRHDSHPHGNATEQRAAWVRDRLAELALWRHQLDAGQYHYVEGGHPDRPFRVS